MESTVVLDEHQVITKLCSTIEKIANAAIELNDIFRIGLSGGSLIKFLCTGLPCIETDWSKWKFFFCDERYVEENDSESTFGCYKRDLIPKICLSEQQFVKINTQAELNDCAIDYEQKILKEFNITDNTIPSFDLLLLGMGPDGHTCSLFPDHKLLKETVKLIAPIDDSPKPPPKRITMTFPLINNSKYCIFAMSGASKAEMVKRVFVNKENLPSAMVKPKNGILKCIFDKEAAKYVAC